ncbi:TetR/AcrR family transcriptional regulator [Lacticaseibacillus daqingensis]|uniref:TetR/AcrR family transcriptional regulator n=1 Tax=Lacticaseibacillus daqingensis TaxID=2486014 RepID=UPI000F76AF93|nr:TetR/AcrR family transcriptional regulator [Lacticaseibacillus daqingensis]
MNKRERANDQVKLKLENALFELLAKERFSNITVTALITTAGVARASYYRNFDSKEAIIESYMARQRQVVAKAIAFSQTARDLFITDKLTISLTHYRQQQARLLLLYDQGLGTAFLEEMNRFAEAMLGYMPRHSITRYQIYFLAGAMFNMTLQWLREGARDEPAALAHEFTRLLQNSMATLISPTAEAEIGAAKKADPRNDTNTTHATRVTLEIPTEQPRHTLLREGNGQLHRCDRAPVNQPWRHDL